MSRLTMSQDGQCIWRKSDGSMLSRIRQLRLPSPDAQSLMSRHQLTVAAMQRVQVLFCSLSVHVMRIADASCVLVVSHV